MAKNKGIFIRLEEKEKKYLMNLAKTNGLSLSEYIRIRLLEESKEDLDLQYKREMSTFGLIAYYTLGKIAKKQLTEEEIKDARAKANAVLKKWNMQD
jgi:hypothetical protein